ncbi:MAG: Ldh family oxidoreductase [Methylorubrum extorquens]
MIHGSGHLAALGMFTLRAAEQGMVAFLCQATPPIMAVQGARIRAIGNNPLSFAAPLRDRPPLVFDMTASTVARGHVAAAARDGLAIPPDWAIGPDGNLTQDPNQALLGAMLPVAGHKGLGLAMLVQCLTVSLAGSGLADSWTAGNSPAFLMLINPDLMDGRVAFEARTEAWLATYLATFPAAHRYPGQRAAECEAERSANGIPLSLGLLATLQRVGELTGVRPPSANDSLYDPASCVI